MLLAGLGVRAQTVGGHVAVGTAWQMGNLAPTAEARALYNSLQVSRGGGVGVLAGLNLTTALPNGLWLQPELNIHHAMDEVVVSAIGPTVANLPQSAEYTQRNASSGTELAVSVRYRPYSRNTVLPYALAGGFLQLTNATSRTSARLDEFVVGTPFSDNDRIRYMRLGLLLEGGLQFALVPKEWSLHVGIRGKIPLPTTFVDNEAPSRAWASQLRRLHDVEPALQGSLRQVWVVGIIGLNKHFGCY